MEMMGEILEMLMMRRIVPSNNPSVFLYQRICVPAQRSVIIHVHEIITFENNPDLCSHVLGSFCGIALSEEYFCCVNKFNIQSNTPFILFKLSNSSYAFLYSMDSSQYGCSGNTALANLDSNSMRSPYLDLNFFSICS